MPRPLVRCFRKGAPASEMITSSSRIKAINAALSLLDINPGLGSLRQGETALRIFQQGPSRFSNNFEFTEGVVH